METCLFKEGECFSHNIEKCYNESCHRSDRGEFAGSPIRRSNVPRPEAPSEGRGEAVSKGAPGTRTPAKLNLAIFFSNVILSKGNVITLFFFNVISKCNFNILIFLLLSF